jgi:hypothetical protein
VVLLFSLGWVTKSLMPNAKVRKNKDDDERTNEEYIWVYLQGKGIDSGWRAYSHHQDNVGVIRATSSKKGLK